MTRIFGDTNDDRKLHSIWIKNICFQNEHKIGTNRIRQHVQVVLWCAFIEFCDGVMRETIIERERVRLLSIL